MSSRTIGGDAESFTQPVHSVEGHAGLPGVPDAEAFTSGVHAGTNHEDLPGLPRFTGILQWGGNWGGGTAVNFQLGGVVATNTDSSADTRHRAYIPYSGQVVAMSWSTLNNTTRRIRLNHNGASIVAFEQIMNVSNGFIIPTPQSFTAGQFIHPVGLSGVGAGDPNGTLIQLYILASNP